MKTSITSLIIKLWLTNHKCHTKISNSPYHIDIVIILYVLLSYTREMVFYFKLLDTHSYYFISINRTTKNLEG